MGRRRRVALQVVVFCLIAGLVGLVAARFVKSPAERAAASAPPPRTQLTAVVERRVLIDDIVARGAVSTAGTVEATPTSAYGAEVVTVTRKPLAQGDAVRRGAVVLEVSGRPLVALPGDVPAYRTLTQGDRGSDVTELQRALGATGHPVGDPDGRFGASTASALRGLYSEIGYVVAEDGDDVKLPLAEVVYVPHFPARIERLDAKVGGQLGSPAVVISYGALKVRAKIDPIDAPLVERGQRATLTAPGGESVDAVVGKVPPATVTSIGDDGAYLPVPIVPDRPLPASWNGFDVEVDITAAGTDGPVLVVPLAAISTSADGSTSVTRVDRDESAVVPVDVGVNANGFVEVTPTEGRLRAGDRVVIGAQ